MKTKYRICAALILMIPFISGCKFESQSQQSQVTKSDYDIFMSAAITNTEEENLQLFSDILRMDISVEQSISIAERIIEQGVNLNKLNRGSPFRQPILFEMITETVSDRNSTWSTGINKYNESRSYELMKFLFKNGANPYIRNEEGMSLLHYSCMRGCPKITELLLSVGLNVDNIWDKTKDTPILSVIQYASLDKEENYTLSYIKIEKQIECILVLIENGANVNYDPQLNKAYSPLILAVYNNQVDIVKLLLKHGADVNFQNKLNDKTACDYAAEEGLLDILEVLRLYGGKTSSEL